MAKLSIGEFLAVLRKSKGLTQEEVAQELGVSSKSVSSWENNRTCPDITLLPVIAEFYGITVDELVRGERNKEGGAAAVEFAILDAVCAGVIFIIFIFKRKKLNIKIDFDRGGAAA